MPLEIKTIVADAKALCDKIQTAIAAGEHVFKTSAGTLNSPQLVNAASALNMAITNLQGHQTLIDTNAAQNVVDTLKAKIAAAKTLGQDAAAFEKELADFLKPKTAATAAPATAAAAPAAPQTPKA